MATIGPDDSQGSYVLYMRLGISPFGSTRAVVETLATTAVDGGLDTLWLGDGYLATSDFPGWRGAMESMTTLAWLAGTCPTARVGITAAVLPMRDIPWLAKQANTLHQVAGGGFVLAVAAGYWAHDLEARGVSFDTRGELFRNQVHELRANLEDAGLGPGPVEGDPVPVWLAGSTATMKFAVANDLPFQASRATPDELAPIAKRYLELGGTALNHRLRIVAGDTSVEGDRVEWHAVEGSPAQIADAFGQFRDMGVTDISIIPGHDDASAQQTVDVLVADVLPQLK